MNHLEYYKDPIVRKRIAQYCGAEDGSIDSITAEYLVGYGESLLWDGLNDPFFSTTNQGFNWILDKGLDIFRSNWDSGSTLAVLDVEYVNFDYPGEPYFRQNETFEKLEPLYTVILEVFSDYGITPFVLVTGQGYHFVFRTLRDSKSDKELEKIGFLPSSLKGKYRSFSHRRRKVSLAHGMAFEGIGRLLEFLTHKIIKRSEGRVSIPLQITDVMVGAGKNGREIISLDLSAYGDPLYMRDIRCAFSTHQKHRVQRYKVGDSIAIGTPIQVSIPRKNLSLQEVLGIRRSYEDAVRLAKNSDTIIPSFDKRISAMISDYKKSELYKIHQYIEKERIHTYDDWNKTYDIFDFSSVPPCISYALLHPNDHLLKPTNIQNTTRALMSLGWHPAHIAGLIQSKYERDYDWGTSWFKYDAASRAKFYVRIFSSLILNHIDNQTDFNCVSQTEKGYCLQPDCGYNLADFTYKGADL